MPDIPASNGINPIDSIPKIPFLKRFSKKTLFLMAGLIFLLLMVITAILLSNSGANPENNIFQALLNPNKSSSSDSGVQTNVASKSDLNTLVYGAWEAQKSVIRSVDLLSGESTPIAKLPLSIKKVSILSPSKLVYINDTNIQDHGKQITSYQIKNKTAQVIVKASDGFGIDDYVLSPNKKYMAIWEVALSPDSKILQGGRSRVYAVDLSKPSTKNLLFDESANSPVHYPQAIMNDGRVFADSFLPNDPNGGAGWAYGISVINFDGSGRWDLPHVQNGSYGTQPFPSADGKFLAFAGYDNSRGEGSSINNNYRQALLTPNTVEVLNTETLKRQKLPNLPNTDIYSSVDWGSSTDLILTILSKDNSRTGLYSYNLASNSLKMINLPKNKKTSLSYIVQLGRQGILMGSVDEAPSSLGNLGDGYIPSLTKLYVQKGGASAANILSLDAALVQYITVLPDNYFQGVLGVQAPSNAFNPIPTLIDFPQSLNTGNRQNLQLRTFELPKQDLAIIRDEMQTSYPTSIPTPTPTNIPTRVPTSTPTPTPTLRPFATNPPFVTPRPTTRPTSTPTRTPTPRPPTPTSESSSSNSSTPTPTRTPTPTTTPSPTTIPKLPFNDDCTDLAEQQCNAMGYKPKSEAFYECVDTNKEKNRATRDTKEAVCKKSPLYIYGKPGQTIQVQIHTKIYNDKPSYENGYSVTLHPAGKMEIDNSAYDAINYDYRSNLRIIKPPTTGTIAKLSEIEKVLRKYGKKLGLNEKEIADNVKFGKEKIKSPYVFISFYDHETSHQILPLSFVPEPDNYLNVVFYFKQLTAKPNFTPAPPVFPAPIRRDGLTAVEVSETIE